MIKIPVVEVKGQKLVPLNEVHKIVESHIVANQELMVIVGHLQRALERFTDRSVAAWYGDGPIPAKTDREKNALAVLTKLQEWKVKNKI